MDKKILENSWSLSESATRGTSKRNLDLTISENIFHLRSIRHFLLHAFFFFFDQQTPSFGEKGIVFKWQLLNLMLCKLVPKLIFKAWAKKKVYHYDPLYCTFLDVFGLLGKGIPKIYIPKNVYEGCLMNKDTYLFFLLLLSSFYFDIWVRQHHMFDYKNSWKEKEETVSIYLIKPLYKKLIILEW